MLMSHGVTIVRPRPLRTAMNASQSCAKRLTRDGHGNRCGSMSKVPALPRRKSPPVLNVDMNGKA